MGSVAHRVGQDSGPRIHRFPKLATGAYTHEAVGHFPFKALDEINTERKRRLKNC